MPATGEATLIIAASEADANLYYATCFLAPDPFIFLEVAGEKILLLSDLEIDRGRQQAAVQTILRFSRYEEEARRAGEGTGLAAAAGQLLRERGVSAVQVPASFPLGLADDLRARGLTVRAKPDPFYEARTAKTAEEVAAISHALAATEGAMDVAIGALRAAEVHEGVLTLEGEVLTSERVKRMIAAHLLERDYLAQHTIVAGGEQGCDPHPASQEDGPLHHRKALPVRPPHPQGISLFEREELITVPAKILHRDGVLVGEGERLFTLAGEPGHDELTGLHLKGVIEKEGATPAPLFLSLDDATASAHLG